MKKIAIILLLIISSLFALAQQDSIYVVETPIYLVYYSYTKQQPLHLEYKISCNNGKVARSADFWTDTRWKTSDGLDYLDNIWDKGHLAPAASFNCTKAMMKISFSYLNCALQHESLNRGVWAQLEGFERDLAKFYKVNVSVDVMFDSKCEVLPSGATVPRGFVKTISWEGKRIKFYFPNENTTGKSWSDFMIK